VKTALLLASLLLAACRTTPGPHDAASSYAKAIAENRLDDAYALTAAEQRAHETPEQFKTRYADPRLREERAAAILGSLQRLQAPGAQWTAVNESDGWRVAELPSADEPRKALAAFLDAAQKGDFEAAHRLLAAPWRLRYSPQRLAEDFKAEPQARDRLERARMALSAEPVWTPEGAQFPLGEGREVRLTREPEGFRVAALE
jgi:hypothetical protein